MSVNGITSNFQPIKPLEGLNKPLSTPEKGSGASFGQMLDNAMKEVDQLQTQADEQIEGLTLKREGVTPHGAMVALEKADVAFQLMSAIRGKIIRAYEEVIRTQV